MKVKTFFKEKPERNPKYLEFIRSKPCLKCGCLDDIHSHHENKEGHGSTGSKCSDKRTLPLCGHCHLFDSKSRHRVSRYEFWCDIDYEGLIVEYNKEWALKKLYK